jgi:hypothetical protein
VAGLVHRSIPGVPGAGYAAGRFVQPATASHRPLTAVQGRFELGAIVQPPALNSGVVDGHGACLHECFPLTRAQRVGHRPPPAPRRSHAFLFVGLGAVGQRMALSLQPKAFTAVLHDVRPEPVAALVGGGAEDGRAIAGDRARV